MAIEKRLARADLEVKSIDEASHTIKGMATTPGPDRVGDVVEPLGAQFAGEIPLFMYHDSRMQVGTARLGPASKAGIPFIASLPNVVEEGSLRDMVQEAWQRLKYNLLKTVSIGFTPIGDNVELLKSGGIRFLKTEILELSLVPIPMNADAEISYIKAIDEGKAPALGQSQAQVIAATPPPGASGQASTSVDGIRLKGVPARIPKVKIMKQTIAERLKDAVNQRAANVAAMQTIMDEAAEKGLVLDQDGEEKYDELDVQVKGLDSHISRLQKQEKYNAGTAVAVVADDVTTTTKAAATPASRIVMGKANLPKGCGFTRLAIALAFSKGNPDVAAKMAERWKDTTPEVAQILHFASSVGGTDFAAQQMQNSSDYMQKAAIAGGNTTDATWASPLVQYNNLASEFVALLYPKTILGRINGLRRVPFNIRFPSQTAGASVGWVGQGAAKPVSKLAFATNTLGFAKAAGIVVITQELARFSSPSAEALVRDDLINTMSAFEDTQFINPGIAALSNVSPAAITNGITPVQSTGATRALIDADVANVLSGFLSNNIPLDNLVWVMTPYNALKLSLLREANGQPSYPDIGINGGTWEGIPVITSNNVPNSVSAGSVVVLMAAGEVFYAEDGGVQLDASEQASLQMDSAPTNNGTGAPTATTLVSLWQDNLIGIRAEHIVNWQRRRDAGVGYIDNAHF